MEHLIPTQRKNDGGASWSFSGTHDNPIFSASINSFATYPDTLEVDYRCHFFIRNGQIEFCGDCTHEHKGKTMDLPDIDPKKWIWVNG